MGQSAPAPGSLARSPPIRGAQVHLDAQVVPRRSRCAPRNTPPAKRALIHPGCRPEPRDGNQDVSKRSCARLTRSQPSHPRRAGAPRRPGRPAPVAVRAPQHPARQTCFDTSWLPSRASSSEVPAQPLEFHSLQGSPIEALRRAVDDEPRTSRAARLRPRICDRSGWHPPALDHIRIAQHTFGEVTNTEA